jgi:hypothetical protein
LSAVTKVEVADTVDDIKHIEATRPPATFATTKREPPAPPEPESPGAAAERERRYREILGIPEPKPRRRWRR